MAQGGASLSPYSLALSETHSISVEVHVCEQSLDSLWRSWFTVQLVEKVLEDLLHNCVKTGFETIQTG